MEFGADIRRLREAAGIRQETLAAEMGVSQAAISLWETGREPMPRWRYFAAVAVIERISSEQAKRLESTRRRAAALAQGAAQ